MNQLGNDMKLSGRYITEPWGLNGALCQKNGNAINDWIALSASLTAYYELLLQFERLVADRANNSLQMLLRQK